MTSWALLLLASALLATPGLTFSGLNPEGNDLMTADLSQEEQFLENLVLEALQDDQPALKCKACEKIFKLLRKTLGHDITQKAIQHGLYLVCRKIFMPKAICKEIITKLNSKITQVIENGKSPLEICVKLRMCHPTIGL
ncbi:antimicrobial peptide NK-lysin-like [Suricata suricatta]|nr:antimicrobial peptide NK-lysin-like [Suricata suricatta]